jgi:hypothetical protein
VTATNRGSSTETVAVSLSDLTTGLDLGPTLVELPAGAKQVVSFATVAAGAIAAHSWLARVTFAGDGDANWEDNERSAVVTVEQADGLLPVGVSLSLAPDRSVYRRGERIRLSLNATEANSPVSRLRVRIVLQNPTGQTVFRWTVATNTKGQVTVLLPSTLRTVEGLYRAEATAEQRGLPPNGSHPPPTTFTTFQVVR